MHSRKNTDQNGGSGYEIRPIAVLPFDNNTGDNSQYFLAFGMHDALIGELGQLGSIRVLSKTSVSEYSDSEKSIKEIAIELEADAIIRGSIILVSKAIRIQLRLIQAYPEEKQLWMQTYDVDMPYILIPSGSLVSKIKELLIWFAIVYSWRLSQ